MARYSMVMDTKLEKMIEVMSGRKKITKANAIRNAVVVLDLLEKETSTNKKSVAIVNERGEVEKLIILPQ